MKNSKSYWDKQFSNKIEIKMKQSQARFFGDVFFTLLPEWLKTEIFENNYSICDFGCGLGDFTNIVKHHFKNSPVTGIDFSNEAINFAKNEYKNIDFICDDYKNLSAKYDVIVTSNTLEHFSNPFEIAKSLVEFAENYLMILIPFQEFERYSEHLFTFEESNIPNNIGGFDLCFAVVEDCSSKFNTMWVGKQVLLIYSKIQKPKKISFVKNCHKNLFFKFNLCTNVLRRDLFRFLRKIMN